MKKKGMTYILIAEAVACMVFWSEPLCIWNLYLDAAVSSCFGMDRAFLDTVSYFGGRRNREGGNEGSGGISVRRR